MHHVLVTGGAGFIGSHTVERLLSLGHRVTVLDDFSTGRRENLAAVSGHSCLRVVEGDVAEPIGPQLAEAVAGFGPVTEVLHLAAQVSVALSVSEPLEDARRNLVGTLRVLEFARELQVDKVVFASSAAAYGDGPQPAHEGLECRPLSPYGLHKLAGEHHLRIHSELTGLGALSFRFFNVFGPRQSPRSHYAGVISIFIGRALAGESLSIFGKGDATRDFVYVVDLVSALVKGLFSGPRRGEVLNVGTGVPTSVAALARTVIEVTGSASPVVELPPRAGDILHSRADATRIREALGWSAETPLA
ncbi:MAG TPA: NAD-dependent epimerase/dehydratase family protein, partial [Myxococcota bacterium]|nr:NAD-dependent epimerase/dehydratase family protein [Myxococcota bacterium]